MKKEIKEQVRKSVTKYIRILIDKKYQERIWAKFEGPEVDSYADFICDFYPLLEEIVDNSKKFSLSEKEEFLLKNLYEKLDAYDDKAPENDDARIVYDPKWDEIRVFAKVVLEALEENKP